MPQDTIATCVPALKSGFISDYESSTIVYAVFDKEVAETEVGFPIDQDPEEFAFAATGWYRSYRGPGQAFSHAPYLKVYGKKVLIKQTRGRDI